MKGYHDIAGDGGSRVLEQVAEQRARIADGLAGVRHLVAVGSGKGGVGKSTLTLQLAGALRARGLRIAILDADFNGPSQARMAGVQDGLFVPGRRQGRAAADQRRDRGLLDGLGDPGVGGARLRERGARRIAYVARHAGSSRSSARSSGPSSGARSTCCCSTCRPEPSGPSSTPSSSGRATSFLLVTIPSEVARGVVARSVAALSKGPNRLLGYVENMSGYYCRDCDAIKPLFASPDSVLLERRRAWRSPASGPSRSIPSWPGTAIGGSRSPHCTRAPWAVPWSRSRSGFWTASNLQGVPDEVPLRPV